MENNNNLPLFVSDIHGEVKIRSPIKNIKDIPIMTIPEVFDKTVKEHGDWIGLTSCEGKDYTFKEYYELCKKYF